MKELLERLELKEKHFDWQKLNVPVVEPGLYNTLGRRLFDLYRKYNISESDQREFESIAFVLHSFVEARKQKNWWGRMWKREV